MDIKINAENLFLKAPLYKGIPFEVEDAKELSSIFNNKISPHQFDAYCIECKKDAVFKSDYIKHTSPHGASVFAPDYQSIYNSFVKRPNVLTNSFYCQRDTSHIYHMFFISKGSKLYKIGQNPSPASIQAASIAKYKNLLKNDFDDFKKAINLFTSGHGIGSFVYLRRIFENLIEEKHVLKMSESNWDELHYQRSKMDEKIKILSDLLPEVLVANRKLYSIISKGIHELSEEECMQLFPDIQLAIELILDEKINMIEREAKIKRVGNFMSTAVESLKRKD